MNTKIKYATAFVLVALLLLGVNQVMAEDSQGTLQVERPGPYVGVVVMPTPVDPGTTQHVTFEIYCVGGYAFDNIVSLRASFHHSSVAEAGVDVITTRYTIDYDNTNNIWTSDADPAYFQNLIMPPAGYGGVNFVFEVDLAFPKCAAVGSWNLDLYVVDIQPSEHRVITPFEVSAFMEVTLMESTFEFESGFAGNLDLVIADPASGHLTFTVIANFDWKVEVMGTNLAGPAGSIPVTSVTHNSVGVVSTEALLLTWAELFGLGIRPACVTEAGEDVLIFLWVDIPAGQAYGTYTMTFSVQALAAV